MKPEPVHVQPEPVHVKQGVLHPQIQEKKKQEIKKQINAAKVNNAHCN